MTSIHLGTTATGAITLPLRLANRHGLVTGATGTGKTCTLQVLAEGFSRAGVPVFAADIKGDLSGLAAAGNGMVITTTPERFPVCFWDLWGEMGTPIRTTVHEMGPLLLARMLGLNDVQEGVLNIAFRWSPWGEAVPMRDLHDLRARLSMMMDHAEEIKDHYGHFAPASVATIQRALLVLDVQGGHHLFGEPALEIADFMRVDSTGRGVINLLHADRLMDTPKLYATFLLWLLSSLFQVLPECGDLPKPRLVFFFDEAHLLFADAPAKLLETVERLVRLIRSRGVGVYFVTQSPRDVPDSVGAQLGHRIQHALRVFTPRDRRNLRAIADGFRPPVHLAGKGERAVRAWIEATVPELATGEALVSVLSAGTGTDAIPSPVERVRMGSPASQIGPVTDFERDAIRRADPLARRYGQDLAREAQWRAFLDRLVAKGELPAAAVAEATTAPPPPRPTWWQRLTGRAA